MKTQASEHATSELMSVKSILQQTNSQLTDTQQVLARKVSNKAWTLCKNFVSEIVTETSQVTFHRHFISTFTALCTTLAFCLKTVLINKYDDLIIKQKYFYQCRILSTYVCKGYMLLLYVWSCAVKLVNLMWCIWEWAKMCTVKKLKFDEVLLQQIWDLILALSAVHFCIVTDYLHLLSYHKNKSGRLSTVVPWWWPWWWR